jgi:predicted PurR-regulated permease PerM
MYPRVPGRPGSPISVLPITGAALVQGPLVAGLLLVLIGLFALRAARYTPGRT